MLPVVNMLPRQRQVLARFSISALVASLPLLYVSLLRPPPAALAGDTAFWFLMSNCVIAAIVAADDAGALFFSSKDGRPCDHDGDGISCVSGGQPVAVESGGDAVVPLAAFHGEATAVNVKGGLVQEEVAATATSSHFTGHALPFLIIGDEEDEDTASMPGTDLNHASVPQQGEEDEVAIEPTTDTGEGEGEGEGEDVGELAITMAEADGEFAEPPEPEPCPRLVKSKSLQEQAGADVGELPTALHSRTPDVPAQDKSVVAAREGELRRSPTEGSKPTAEESEYWELSDEELNRRVEEFIARFNREMRLQIEQDCRRQESDQFKLPTYL